MAQEDELSRRRAVASMQVRRHLEGGSTREQIIDDLVSRGWTMREAVGLVGSIAGKAK